MLNVSNEYIELINQPMREFDIKVLINDQEISNEFIISAKIEELSCSGDVISIGDVCTNAFELEMYKVAGLGLDKAKVIIQAGLKLTNGVEWFNLGVYYVNDVSDDKYKVKLSGYDASKRLEVVYEPDIIYNLETKYKNVLNDLLRQCNLTLASIDLSEYEEIVIDHYYENITCKEFLGYLAGLAGYNVRVNRFDQLEFYWYQDSDVVIDDELVYQDGYEETTAGEIVINSLTSGDEKDTLVCGTGTGISFANPYMSQVLLEMIFTKVGGFKYQPCNMKWRGNLALEATDIVTYKTKHIVVTKQTLILDGGLSSSIECLGKLSDDVVMKTPSPTEIKLNKLYNTMITALKNSSEKILGNQGGYFVIDTNEDGLPSGWTIMNTPTLQDNTCLWKFTNGGLGYSEDGGKTLSNAAIDMAGNINANFVTTGILRGEMFELDLTTGVVKIGKRDGSGEISDPSLLLDENGALTIKQTKEIFNSMSGDNLIRDSIGCFNDNAWEGDYYLDSSNEIRARNMYGYAILLKAGSLKQIINVKNGIYTLSFAYHKMINLASAKLIINGTEYVLDKKEEFDVFKQSFSVSTGSIEIEFITDTDKSCSIINLLLNEGEEAKNWSLNSNETWSDTVKIGRGVRISSIGSEVEFVAYADVIGFKNKQDQYITTFDDEGMIVNSIVVKNKATIVNLLIQDINGQTIINRINPEEVEVSE